jgi:hypothetical protein
MSKGDAKPLSLGPIQIITKSLIIIAAISIFLRELLDHFLILGPNFYMTADRFSKIYYVTTGVIFLCFVGFFMIINNNWLVKRILPTEESISIEQQKIWFGASLRILFMFYGVFLLSHSTVTVVYITVHLREWLRLWFSGILWSSLFTERNLSTFCCRVYSLSFGILGGVSVVRSSGVCAMADEKDVEFKITGKGFYYE